MQQTSRTEGGQYIHTEKKCEKLCIVKKQNDSHIALFNSPILCHSTKPNILDGNFNLIVSSIYSTENREANQFIHNKYVSSNTKKCTLKLVESTTLINTLGK